MHIIVCMYIYIYTYTYDANNYCSMYNASIVGGLGVIGRRQTCHFRKRLPKILP